MKYLDETLQLTSEIVMGKNPKFPRRQFFGVATILSSLLYACGNRVSQAENPKLASLDAETREFLESGIPLDVGIEEVDFDTTLSIEAKQLLWGRIALSEADASILQAWTKTTVPQALIDAGLYQQTDVSQVFVKKRVGNGGLCVCDTKNALRLKVAIEATPEGVRLAEAAEYFRNSWRSIGVPESYVNQIQLVRAGNLDGQAAVILVTPDMGSTFESFAKNLKLSGAPEADALLARMMEEYYRNVLLPMNAEGILQPDLNWKNIIVSRSPEGPRLIPIDLAQPPKVYVEGMIFQQQYEALRARAAGGGRNITLPTWEEYLAKNPDVAQSLSQFEYINTTKPFTIELVVGNRKTKITLPEELIAANYSELSSEAKFARITEVRQSIEGQLVQNQEFLKAPQGGMIAVEVSLADGTRVPVSVMKATAYGSKIESFGSRYAKLLQVGKNLTRFAADFLMVAWIATEVNRYTDPAFQVNLQSNIAFPDSVPEIGKMEGSGTLTNIFNLLRQIKDEWALQAGGDARVWSASMEAMLGITSDDARIIMGNYGVTQDELKQIMRQRAAESLFPVAQVNDEFASPVPLLLPGDSLPMTAWFSAFEDLSTGTDMMMLWGQSSTNASQMVPIAIFSSESGTDDPWTMQPLASQGWKIETNLYYSGAYAMTCEPSSDGTRFTIECVKKEE